MQSNAYFLRSATRAALTLGGLAALLTAPVASRAAISGPVFSISPTATAPGASGVFDVLLTNNSVATYDIAGFSYELTSGTNATFTGVTADPVSTADGHTYIFTPFVTPYDITGSGAGTHDITAGDVDFVDVSGYHALAPGQTVSLGDVGYTVAVGASPGSSIPVTFANVYPNGTQATELADTLGNPIPATASNGSITVANVSSVPEPSSVAAFGFTGLIAAGLMLRARKRAAS